MYRENSRQMYDPKEFCNN